MELSWPVTTTLLPPLVKAHIRLLFRILVSCRTPQPMDNADFAFAIIGTYGAGFRAQSNHLSNVVSMIAVERGAARLEMMIKPRHCLVPNGRQRKQRFVLPTCPLS